MDFSDLDEEREPLEMWQAVLILIPLCTITLWIVVSNAFVILAVACFSSMRTPPNVYLASLAFTDLSVGVLILPLNIIQIVFNRWILSQGLCKTWLTMDVTLSTLSIVHLIAIAVDRYRAVSDGIIYVQNRTTKDVLSVILCLWIVCSWISTPPVLGWGNWMDIERENYLCDYSTTLGYVIHSAFGSFIFPMILMIKIYSKIYSKIQKRLKVRTASTIPTPTLDNSMERELSETETSGDLLKRKGGLLERAKANRRSITASRPSSQFEDFVSKKIRFSLTKERRAARTLGVIIGAFMICWLPFCIMYILRPLVGDPPVVIYHLITWLGYMNSAANPIIYCIFSRDFKRVFNRMLCCCRSTKNKAIITIP